MIGEMVIGNIGNRDTNFPAQGQKGENGKEILIPYIEDVVKKIDIKIFPAFKR